MNRQKCAGAWQLEALPPRGGRRAGETNRPRVSTQPVLTGAPSGRLMAMPHALVIPYPTEPAPLHSMLAPSLPEIFLFS